MLASSSGSSLEETLCPTIEHRLLPMLSRLSLSSKAVQGPWQGDQLPKDSYKTVKIH